MRVMVTGSRHYTDAAFIHSHLAAVNPDLLILGDALGADAIARDWAIENVVNMIVCTANWKGLGRAAGPQRNAEMVALQPDLVLAFPLLKSRGTWNAVSQARQAGIETRVLWPDP